MCASELDLEVREAITDSLLVLGLGVLSELRCFGRLHECLHADFAFNVHCLGILREEVNFQSTFPKSALKLELCRCGKTDNFELTRGTL